MDDLGQIVFAHSMDCCDNLEYLLHVALVGK